MPSQAVEAAERSETETQRILYDDYDVLADRAVVVASPQPVGPPAGRGRSLTSCRLT
jgi:hypothetical protein